jgi:hypothetical protein
MHRRMAQRLTMLSGVLVLLLAPGFAFLQNR